MHSQGAIRGTAREYECVLILRPTTSKDGIKALVDRIQGIFSKAGGRLQKIDNWGLRTLAYPIAKHKQGVYLYVQFLGGSDLVLELERNLRIWEEIVRYLTVVIDEDVDPSARPSEVNDELLSAATESAPDPVEIARAEAEARAAEEAAAAEAAAQAAEAQAAAEAATAAATEGSSETETPAKEESDA